MATNPNTWLDHIESVTVTHRMTIITAVGKDGDKWTLVSDDFGDEVLVNPSGVHVDLDTCRDNGLVNLALDILEEVTA